MRISLIVLGVSALIVSCGKNDIPALGTWTTAPAARSAALAAVLGAGGDTETATFSVNALEATKTCSYGEVRALGRVVLAPAEVVAKVTVPAQVSGSQINVVESKTLTAGTAPRQCTVTVTKGVVNYRVEGNKLILSDLQGRKIGEMTRK